MAKYTDSEKSEIIARFGAGEDPTAIAASLGKNPFGVNSVIRAHRVKMGEIPDPLLGKRGRKPKVLDDGAEAPSGTPDISVRIRQTRANGNGHAPSLAGMPLFGGEASKVQVHRLRQNPPAPGEGYLAEEHGAVTLEEIKTRFGGGTYEFRAFDGARFIRNTRETIGGFSIPAEPLMEAGSAGGYWPVHETRTDQRVFDMMKEERSAADERRRDDREREERAAERERLRQEAEATRQREWLTSQQATAQQQMATMMQMQQAAAAQQTQLLTTMLTAAMGQGNKLTEMITALGAMKDLVGGDSGDDPITAAITNAPKMIDSIKDLVKMKQSPLLAAHNPQPGQPQDDPAAAALVFKKQLMASGMTEDEADAEMMRCFNYLDKKVREKQAAVLQKQRAATARPPAMSTPSTAAPPVAAPSPAPNGPAVPQAKVTQ